MEPNVVDWVHEEVTQVNNFNKTRRLLQKRAGTLGTKLAGKKAKKEKSIDREHNRLVQKVLFELKRSIEVLRDFAHVLPKDYNFRGRNERAIAEQIIKAAETQFIGVGQSKNDILSKGIIDFILRESRRGEYAQKILMTCFLTAEIIDKSTLSNKKDKNHQWFGTLAEYYIETLPSEYKKDSLQKTILPALPTLSVMRSPDVTRQPHINSFLSKLNIYFKNNKGDGNNVFSNELISKLNTYVTKLASKK